MSAASKPELRVIERPLDIAARLDAEARTAEEYHPSDTEIAVMREAAALIRDLDAAISHAIAVKGSVGLSPRAISVLYAAISRQKRRAGAAGT